MRYFAFTTSEEILLVGDFSDISEAMDCEPNDTQWVLSEDGLKALMQKMEAALKREELK